MSIKDKYAFVGVGLTRLGKIPEMTPDELAAQAIILALADAGMRPNEVDGYIYQQGIGGGLKRHGSFTDDGHPRLAGLAGSQPRFLR